MICIITLHISRKYLIPTPENGTPLNPGSFASAAVGKHFPDPSAKLKSVPPAPVCLVFRRVPKQVLFCGLFSYRTGRSGLYLELQLA